MSVRAVDTNAVEAFESQGFVALRQFVGAGLLSEIISNLDRFRERVVPTIPARHVFYEDKAHVSSLKQLQHMDRYDRWFGELFHAGPFRILAESLLRGDVVPKNLQYFNKPAMIGRPTPAHQDGYYFMLDPCEAVTMWLALDEVDKSNGCVRYVPGSHQRGMRQHARTGTLGFSQGIVDYPTREDRQLEVAIAAQPGDLLAHHAMTIHRADGNTSSNRSRRALGFIFYSQRAREDTAAHEAYQKRLAAELAADGKI